MTRFLFFSLAKHQSTYFQRLLTDTALEGKVMRLGRMPWPRPWLWSQVAERIDWVSLVDAKCRERRVKRKYDGRLYRFLLHLELIWFALRAQALLDRERPQALVMWNGSHRYCQILLALLRPGCETFFFENGLLPNTITLDRKGVNYRNSVPRDAAFFSNYNPLVESAFEDELELIPRKPRHAGEMPITLPERFIFIPFQDDRDTQVRLFSPWIRNMRELFSLGEYLARETGMAVVFKEHPSSREDYPDLHRRVGEHVCFANGNPIQELIESSEYVITLNSTVGVESLLLGKPVLTLGQAFFNIPGLVMHADSAEEIVKLAKTFPDWPLSPLIRQNFLCYLTSEYCIKGNWREPDIDHLQRVAQRMRGDGFGAK